MGYTHYWTQKRDFTKDEWKTVCEDIGAILKYAQHDAGIALADGMGTGGTSPELLADKIWFNGVEDDSHETMSINRRRPPKEDWQSVRGRDFCKTARKPYDSVVVACLCYLSTITRKDDAQGEPIIGTEVYSVASDGHGHEWLEGLELARVALPAKANQIDLPMDLMKTDRWCAPWINCKSDKYEVLLFAHVDGKGYVLNKNKSYCFDTHKALAQYLERTKRVDFGVRQVVSWSNRQENYRIETDIWNAMGCFDEARHARIRKAQERALAKLFPVDVEHSHQPPAYVRPGDMPENAGREFCYSVTELMNYLEA